MKRFLIIRVDDTFSIEIEGYFKTLQEAKEYLQDLKDDYEDWIIGEDYDYFTIENNYGNIEAFRILEIDKKICKGDVNENL